MKPSHKRTVLISALFAIAAILLLAATVFAASGDYGVATGSSSTCGSTSGFSCTMTYNGHSASWTATNTDGTASYKFDDYDCTAVVSSDGGITIGGGTECSNVQTAATAVPTETPEPD